MKTNLTRIAGASLLSALTLMTTNSVTADEGMWLFNNPPRERLKEKYGFDVTDRMARARAEASSGLIARGRAPSFLQTDS